MNDEGVSPVIAVILMVAITVVLAATVYVWVSGFATEDSGPEQAAATAKGVDLSGDGDVEWIQITLTSGQNAPYSHDDVTYSATAPNGTSLSAADADHLCTSAQTDGTHNFCADGTEFFDGDNEWDVGQNLWIPCGSEGDADSNDSGNHPITVSVSGTTILDTSVSCDRTVDDLE